MNALGAAVGALATVLAMYRVITMKRQDEKQSSILLLAAPKQETQQEDDMKLVESLIAQHVDFPLPGILFRDVFPIFQSPSAFSALLRLLKAHLHTLHSEKINVVIGLDARGFLLGPIIAGILNCSFAPVRKPGKLPGELVTISYEKEYGTDSFSLPVSAVQAGDKVLIVDDLLATGGTLHAACELVNRLKGKVVECCVIIELAELGGSARVDSPVWSMFQY